MFLVTVIRKQTSRPVIPADQMSDCIVASGVVVGLDVGFSNSRAM